MRFPQSGEREISWFSGVDANILLCHCPIKVSERLANKKMYTVVCKVLLDTGSTPVRSIDSVVRRRDSEGSRAWRMKRLSDSGNWFSRDWLNL